MSSDKQEVLISTDFANSTADDWSPVSHAGHSLVNAVYTVIACLAVLGNGMVIAVMLVRRRVFSSFTNRLILHQSVIDLIAGVMFFFHHVVKNPNISVSTEGNLFDHFVCRVVASDFLLWATAVTSTYNLVIVSLERFMATCYPVKHRNMWSVRRLKFTKATAWGIGFLYGTVGLIMFVPHRGQCQVMEMGLGLKVFFNAVVLGTEYVLPIIIMTYAYTRIAILMTVKKPKNPGNTQQRILSKAKRNILMMTLHICLMFAVCWTPLEVVFVVTFVTNGSWVGPIYTACTALVMCNMFVNPIIYCFKYRHFRSQLKDLILKRFRRNIVHNSESIRVQ